MFNIIRFAWSHHPQEQKFTSSVVSQLQDCFLVSRRGTEWTRVNNNFVLFFQNPGWLHKTTDKLQIHNWSFCPFISLQSYYGCWGRVFLSWDPETAHTHSEDRYWSVNAPRPNIKNPAKFMQLQHYLHLPRLGPAVLLKVSCGGSGTDPSLHKLKLYVILPGRISKHR